MYRIRIIGTLFSVICLAAVLCSPFAMADSISLSQDATGGFAFSSTTPSSSIVDITISGVISSSAVLSTSGKPVLGTYSITDYVFTKPLTMVLADPSVNVNLWVIKGGPLRFHFGAGKNTLIGNLRLVDLAQAPDGGLTANLNDTLKVNLTHLRGSLAADFGSDAVLNLTLDFPTSERLACLLAAPPSSVSCPSGETTAITADLDHGSVNSTPEPASLTLFGIGLLGVAFLVRRVKAMAR